MMQNKENNKKNILFFGMSENRGGVETFIINYYRELKNDPNIHIDFTKFSDEIAYETELVDSGAKVYRLPERRKGVVKYLRALVAFFKEHPEYDVVHAHFVSLSGAELAIIAKLFKKIVIIHSHSEWKGKLGFTSAMHAFYKPIVSVIADKKIACSQAAGESMFGSAPFEIIRNAIAIDDYAYNAGSRQKIREELCLSESRLVIGHVGFFTYIKNQEYLINVFEQLHKNIPDSTLLLIGDGELRENMETLVKAKGLEGEVIFTGVRSDMNELYQAMDVFVLPSLFEGLPFVAIEAQAAGLPCFISDTVSKEVFITNNAHSISIQDAPEDVAADITSRWNAGSRADVSDELRRMGYDIRTEIEKLRQLYIQG